MRWNSKQHWRIIKTSLWTADHTIQLQDNQLLGWMLRSAAAGRLAGRSCHLVYIIYPDYSQGCFQPARDVNMETCADPLLTEPNSQYMMTKRVKKSLLSGGVFKWYHKSQTVLLLRFSFTTSLQNTTHVSMFDMFILCISHICSYIFVKEVHFLKRSVHSRLGTSGGTAGCGESWVPQLFSWPLLSSKKSCSTTTKSLMKLPVWAL